MKKTLMIIAGLLCLSHFGGNCYAQNRIVASKKIVTRNIPIDKYDCIEVAEWPCLVFTQTQENSDKLTIEASDNLIDLIECTVEDGTLTIRLKEKVSVSFEKKGKAIITSSSPNIKMISLNGSGDIKVNGKLSANQLQIQLNGSGDIVGENINCYNSINLTVNGSGDIAFNSINSNQVTASVNGSGDMKLASLTGEMATVKVNGSGDMNVDKTTSNELTVNLKGSGDLSVKGISSKQVISSLQGSGDIKLSGNTESAILSLKSTGTLEAKDLQSQNVEATLSGSGEITCHGILTLTTNIKGQGTITYKGKPQKLVVLSKKQPEKL